MMMAPMTNIPFTRIKLNLPNHGKESHDIRHFPIEQGMREKRRGLGTYQNIRHTSIFHRGQGE